MNPVVYHQQLSGLRATTAVAGAADTFSVHFRSRDQVIQRPDTVPVHEPLGAATKQRAAHLDPVVRTGVIGSLLSVFAPQLHSLTLTKRIEHECCHAVECQQRSHCLILFPGFCPIIVTARHEHAREGG